MRMRIRRGKTVSVYLELMMKPDSRPPYHVDFIKFVDEEILILAMRLGKFGTSPITVCIETNCHHKSRIIITNRINLWRNHDFLISKIKVVFV